METGFSTEIINDSREEVIFTNGRLNTALLLKNAKILLAAGDTSLAKNIFRALIERGEALGTAYAGLGTTYQLEGKIELAIKAFREAIIYEPSFGALYALAELYIQKEEYKNSVGALLRAQNINKMTAEQSFEIHKALGNCYLSMGQLNNAEAHYRKAYEANPSSDILHINIGSLALKRGDPSTSLLHYKESIRLNPKNSSAQTGAGLAYLSLGNKELAHDCFVAALNINIHDVTALYHVVKCSYELKKFDAAVVILEKYIRHNPVNSNILYSYSGILFHQQKFKLALEECEKLISLNPEHEGAKKLREMVKKKLRGV